MLPPGKTSARISCKAERGKPMSFNVLFLCTGNSARSILGEAILAMKGAPRFGAYSAGSTPKGQPHPMALALLAGHGHDIEGFASKSWDVFAEQAAPKMHLIVTVCDNAAGETCPIWPGGPTTVHWSLPDPADETLSDAEKSRVFSEVYERLSRRIDEMIALPVEEMDAPQLISALDGIPELKAEARA